MATSEPMTMPSAPARPSQRPHSRALASPGRSSTRMSTRTTASSAGQAHEDAEGERDGGEPLRSGDEEQRDGGRRNQGEQDVEHGERLEPAARVELVRSVPGKEQRHQQRDPRDRRDPLAGAQPSQVHSTRQRTRANAARRRRVPGARGSAGDRRAGARGMRLRGSGGPRGRLGRGSTAARQVRSTRTRPAGFHPRGRGPMGGTRHALVRLSVRPRGARKPSFL